MYADRMFRPRASQRLAGCAIVALGMHGLLLAWVQRQPDDATRQARSGVGPAVTVRMLAAVPAKAPAPLPASMAAPREVPTPEPAAVPQARDEAASEEVAGDMAVDLDGYVPRRWLTVAPEPTAPVLLGFPGEMQDRARYTAVLNLYIEADGRVGRVEFEGPPLPEVLARSARSTFLHARFTPGEVAGRIVKSLIRVEVDFNNLGAG